MYYVLKIAINAILNENKNVLIYDLFCSLQFDFFDHVILSHNAIGSGTTAGPTSQNITESLFKPLNTNSLHYL